jgi:tight adherence protein C
MSALLAAACALLVAAALWELAGERAEEARESWRRRVALGRLPAPAAASRSLLLASAQRRIEAADFGGWLSPAALIAAKAATAVLSLPAAAAAAPVAPGRFGSLVLVGVPLAAFLAPDLLLERIARARRERVAAALPDALDLMATGAATGRGPGALLADAMGSASGPLREDLARTVAAIECGTAQETALRELRRRSRGEGLAALAGALERSRRHGSPLAHALHEQAGSLRVEQRRRIGEHAARAAPKMQLVVALLLVPSVLLVVAAAIVANSGELLPSY